MNPFTLTKSVRTLNRLRQIAVVLSQHGFDHVVTKIDLIQFLPVWLLANGKNLYKRKEPESIGVRIRKVCIELGPTFVKLGQMLSTRPDLIPETIRNDLEQLQDQVSPIPFDQVKKTIETAFGKPVSEVYADFDHTPIASGSIGQVHKAVTLQQLPVVVKVKRPGIEDTIELDMELLRWLADAIEEYVPELAVYRPKTIVSEFEKLISSELDYVQEAAVTDKIRMFFEGNHNISIPQIIWSATNTDVLTMTLLPGKKIKKFIDEDSQQDAKINRQELARTLTVSFLDQVFTLGMFHSDPHPGNILLEAPDKLGLIDFGQVGRISEQTITLITIALYAAVQNEEKIVVDVLNEMDLLGEETNRKELSRSISQLLDKYNSLPIKYFDIGLMLNELTDLLRQHDVTLSREIVVLVKAVGMIGGVATDIDPDLNISTLLEPYLRKTLQRRISPVRLLKSSAVTTWHAMSFLREAPGQIRKTLQKLSSGQWQMNVKHQNIDKLSQELDRSSNRLSFSIVIAAIIVGSSVVISTASDMSIFGINIQYFGMAGYLIAGVLGLGLSWAIFRSGRLH